MAEEVFHTFTDSWTMQFPQPGRNTSQTTHRFSPLPNSNASFHFKISVNSYSSPLTLACKLNMLKLLDFEPNFSFKMNTRVTIILEPIVKFSAMRSSDELSEVTEIYFGKFPTSCLQISKRFTIMCVIDFYDRNLTSNTRSVSQSPRPNQKDNTVSEKNDRPSQETSNKSRQENRLPEFVKNTKLVYENGESLFNDFMFKVGEKSLPAHRIILAAHSPVLKKMLTQEFLESKTNCVTITDSTPEIFDLFLKYLYSGEVEDKSWPSVKEMFYLADKYDIRLLKEECIDIAISLLSVDLVCEILKVAFVYDDSKLKSAGIEFAVGNMKEILSRDDWKELVFTDPMIGYEVTVNFVPK